MSVEPMTKHELLEAYPDDTWRSRLIDVLDIVTFLSGCVITNDYKVPDSVANIIPLTEEGDRVFRELTRQQVPAKEARVLCLLEMLHVEPLVDVDAIDVDRLADFVGEQLVSGDILLPPTWGPRLYQRAVEILPDEHRNLTLEETLRLLDEMPVGVFQAGHWVCGPYGLKRSDERRANYPTRRVPIQHCHDLACSEVHDVALETSSGAIINQNRHKIHTVLKKRSESASEWSPFLSEILRNDVARFDDQDLSTLSLLVGDALSVAELRKLLCWLMDSTQGVFRRRLEKFQISGRAEHAAEALDREQLLQVIFLTSDALIFAAIDELALSGRIIVPEGETRVSPLRNGVRSAAFGALVQLSKHGARVKTAIDVSPLRLRRLIDLMYPLSDSASQTELEWQMRSVEGRTLSARLDEYLRTVVPSVAIQQLVLARPRNLDVACKHLRLDRALVNRDDQIVSCILWKLGFDVPAGEDLRDRFWRAHERTIQAGRAATVSAIIDEEALRGTVATYFIELEHVLEDTLAFAAWVLTSDHMASENPFSYDETGARPVAFQILNEFSAKREVDSEHDSLEFGERTSLYPLCRGFGVLADLLDDLSSKPDEHLRDADQWPDFAQNTELQKFPFLHTAVFIDLTTASRVQITALLREVSKNLISGHVSEVRNEQLHFRRSSTDLDRLIACVSSVEAAVRLLDDAGLTRVLYSEKRRESDSWGRSTVFMADRHGREIAFGRPNAYRWLQLPYLAAPQYVLACARFAEPNEPLRVKPRTASEFTSMWSAFPKRPRASARLVTTDGASLGGASSSGAAVGTE